MERCYEYLGCTKKDCVMYGREDNSKCWEVEETQCCNPGLENMKEHGKYKCKYCIYYKAVAKG